MVLQVFIQPCLGLQKLSVLLLYRGFFVGQTFSRIIWSLIGFCVAWTIAFEFAVICRPLLIPYETIASFVLLIYPVSCTPLSFRWDPTVKSHCVNQIVLVRSCVVSDVIIDDVLPIVWFSTRYCANLLKGFILLLSVPKVWKMQMQMPRGLQVLGFFFLGGVTTVTGIICLKFLNHGIHLSNILFSMTLLVRAFCSFVISLLIC